MKLYIEEMSCEHCVNRIENTLEEFGLISKTDLAEKTIEFEIADIIIEDIISALADIGYTAEIK